ncbi:MAG: hypothetical protein ABW208_10180 [Pyrinomonadaceae bacterium]
MDYTDLDDLIRGYLPNVTSDEDKATLAGMITRASRTLDGRTRREENAFAPAPAEAAGRVFYGEGSAVLRISEYVAGSIDSVTGPASSLPEGYVEFRRAKITGLHTATTQKILTPRVAWERGVPYTVTARFGFEATPGAVVEATNQLVRAWWRQQAGETFGAVGDVGQRPQPERGIPKLVDELIAPYVLDDVVAEEDEGTIERGSLFDADTNSTGGRGWGRW